MRNGCIRRLDNLEPPSASDSSAMESIELDEMSLELSGAFWNYEELTHYHLKGHAESQQILARLLVLTIGRISKFIPPPWYKEGGGAGWNPSSYVAVFRNNITLSGKPMIFLTR